MLCATKSSGENRIFLDYIDGPTYNSKMTYIQALFYKKNYLRISFENLLYNWSI